MTTRLSDDAIHDALGELDGWSYRDGKLHRELRFGDFSEAFGFLTRLALKAEAMNHHPEIANVYNRVSIDLVTHDVDGVSDLDLEMARAVDAMT